LGYSLRLSGGGRQERFCRRARGQQQHRGDTKTTPYTGHTLSIHHRTVLA
jgi:hypothetical protein